MYLCCLLPLRDILSYCYGAIWPICAETAVKPQANKQIVSTIKIAQTVAENVMAAELQLVHNCAIFHGLSLVYWCSLLPALWMCSE